jgi:hypothetical protein
MVSMFNALLNVMCVLTLHVAFVNVTTLSSVICTYTCNTHRLATVCDMFLVCHAIGVRELVTNMRCEKVCSMVMTGAGHCRDRVQEEEWTKLRNYKFNFNLMIGGGRGGWCN